MAYAICLFLVVFVHSFHVFFWHVLRRPFILPRLFLDSIQNDSTSWLFVACCLLCGVLLVLALGLFVLILVVVPVGAFFLGGPRVFLILPSSSTMSSKRQK